MKGHALKYAAAGIHVFPLKPHGKTPLTQHGCLDATDDDAIIAEWWRQTPTANIGIATGPTSGLLVVDLDGPEGIATWSALERDRYISTKEAATAGGRHLYFRSSLTVGNTAKRLGPGIDTRGKGGYVVAPPSIHPTGDTYRWLTHHPIAQLPDWLAKMIQAAKPVPAQTYAPRDVSGDPLAGIDPPAYVWLLTGQQVNRTGKTPCPLPGHDDWPGDGGSFQAYARAEQGWFCFGCDRGGDIYSLAKHLWGDEPFPNLRRRLADALLKGGA